MNTTTDNLKLPLLKADMPLKEETINTSLKIIDKAISNINIDAIRIPLTPDYGRKQNDYAHNVDYVMQDNGAIICNSNFKGWNAGYGLWINGLFFNWTGGYGTDSYVIYKDYVYLPVKKGDVFRYNVGWAAFYPYSTDVPGEVVEPGTSDYNNLTNKPSINKVTLIGDKMLEELGIQAKGDYLVEADLNDINKAVNEISSSMSLGLFSGGLEEI